MTGISLNLIIIITLSINILLFLCTKNKPNIIFPKIIVIGTTQLILTLVYIIVIVHRVHISHIYIIDKMTSIKPGVEYVKKTNWFSRKLILGSILGLVLNIIISHGKNTHIILDLKFIIIYGSLLMLQATWNSIFINLILEKTIRRGSILDKYITLRENILTLEYNVI